MRGSINRPLCIIPARSSSRRLPHKNVTLLGGKPLLAWTIEAALGADLFDAVWVSSEDEQTLRIAEHWGGRPLLRRSELASDQVSVAQLCLHIIHDFATTKQDYSALYVLLPTSPFRRSKTILRAWSTFLESEADALLSVIPLEYPPQWAMIQTDGWLRPLYPLEHGLLRQSLVPTYRHDGGHAIADVEKFLQLETFLGPRTLAFPVAAEEAVDINEPLDLAWAEFLLQQGRVKG